MIRQRGYSLIELAVVMAITAVIAVAVWQLLPRALDAGAGSPGRGAAMAREQQAIIGFALVRQRLPCPDTDGDGREDCGSDSIGGYPWQTLGVAKGSGLRYGVGRSNTDLSVAEPAYTPLLPNASGDVARVNGLDFCRRLFQGGGGGTGLSAGGMPVAFALASPGEDGAFATGSASGTFAMPHARSRSPADDTVVALTPLALAGRLGCPQRVAEVVSTQRAAQASWDLKRVTDLYFDFRAFGLRVRETNRDLAIANVAIATAGTAKSLGDLAIAIAVTALTKGGGAADIIVATAGVAESAASLAEAGVGLAESEASVVTAQAQKAAASTYSSEVDVEQALGIARALQQDQWGLLR